MAKIALPLGDSYRYNHCRCGGRIMRFRNSNQIWWECEFMRWWNFWKHSFRSEGTY